MRRYTKEERLATVEHTRWAFYDAKEAGDLDNMADWFETLYIHYKNRGKQIKNK